MSWFSDLANKTEAFLVKLDQKTAEALQTNDEFRSYPLLTTEPPLIVRTDASWDNNNDIHISEPTTSNHNSGGQTPSNCNIPTNDYQQAIQESNNLIGSKTTHSKVINKEINIKNGGFNKPSSDNNKNGRHSAYRKENRPKRFTKAFGSDNQIKNRNKDDRTSDILSYQSENLPNAEDIKASLNKSIEDCARLLNSDQSINLNELELRDADDDDGHLSTRNRGTVNIDFPTMYIGHNDSTYEITHRLLKDATNKTKFTLNDLTSKFPIFNWTAKFLKFKGFRLSATRTQRIIGDWASRLYLYSKVTPVLRYGILAYLFLLQLLVIYVLFFYQSKID